MLHKWCRKSVYLAVPMCGERNYLNIHVPVNLVSSHMNRIDYKVNCCFNAWEIQLKLNHGFAEGSIPSYTSNDSVTQLVE